MTRPVTPRKPRRTTAQLQAEWKRLCKVEDTARSERRAIERELDRRDR